ncbi:MAG: pseudouridine synthase [Proteobacteria bacterium]|nr:pseudouridine synthase [Pseudomonadota bacterium]
MRRTDASGNPLPPKPRRRVRAVSPLPMRDGVSASWVSLPAGTWGSYGHFFTERFPLVTQADWQARMRLGEVVDDAGDLIDPDAPYRPHQRLWYYRALEQEDDIPFEETVLFQDDYLVVADKPHFLPVVPTGRYLQHSLLVRLKRKLGIEALTPAHRIDRGTAGLVIFSVQANTRDRYQTLFRERAVHKVYEAIVPWKEGTQLPPVRRSHLMDDASFLRTREAPGCEPNSETHMQVLQVHGGHAHLRLSPVTGRKHQLRVHCAAMGMPILNDDYYPVLRPEGPDDYSRPLQLLARSVEFTDPVTGQVRRFESQRRLGLPPAAD